MIQPSALNFCFKTLKLKYKKRKSNTLNAFIYLLWYKYIHHFNFDTIKSKRKLSVLMVKINGLNKWLNFS